MLGNSPGQLFYNHPIVRASPDERRKKLSYQIDLSSRIELFCRLAPSPEVSSSKVAVFCRLYLAGVKLFHLKGGNQKVEINT